MRGYKEEGTTTTPFDMTVRNDLDRFHLVKDVAERVPKLAPRAAPHRASDAREADRSTTAYIRKHGEDMPEIRRLALGSADASLARSGGRSVGTPHALRPGVRTSRSLEIVLVALVALIAGGPAALADRGNENMTGKRELQLARCPSAVSGAVTRVTDIDRGVIVSVRAPLDPIAQAEIRRRVQVQLELVDQPERGAIEHTGLGTGSGRYGYCPGMLEHTSIDVEWTSDGATLTIRADRAEDVAHLQATTHKRARALAARLHTTAAR